MEVIDIELNRGPAGLGFNIKGGVDIPHVRGDPGIFIAKIRSKGAAADNGMLKEGDKIIEINGNNVERVKHQEAVGCFLQSGSDVKLKVISGAERIINETLELKRIKNLEMKHRDMMKKSLNGNSWSDTSLTVMGLGIFGISAYVWYRYFIKKH